jgi:hypothetical protein
MQSFSDICLPSSFPGAGGGTRLDDPETPFMRVVMTCVAVWMREGSDTQGSRHRVSLFCWAVFLSLDPSLVLG